MERKEKKRERVTWRLDVRVSTRKIKYIVSEGGNASIESNNFTKYMNYSLFKYVFLKHTHSRKRRLKVNSEIDGTLVTTSNNIETPLFRTFCFSHILRSSLVLTYFFFLFRNTRLWFRRIFLALKTISFWIFTKTRVIIYYLCNYKGLYNSCKKLIN